MIERWTIDSIADEIARQFKGADPQKKLLRRFFNEGRRQRRKGMSPAPMRNFLTNAVELATSKITEDFLEEEQQVAAARAAMQARKAMIEEDLAEDVDPPGGDTSLDSDDGGGGLGAKVGGPDLGAALARLKAHRAASEAEAAAAKRRGEREQMKQDLDGIGEQLALADRKLKDLPEHYRQMIESCHETGELMWTRFVLGFSSDAKGGVPDQYDGPDPDIQFDYPDLLDEGQGRPSVWGEDGEPFAAAEEG